MIENNKRKTKKYLVDIKYKYSMNYFYEFYGENVPYSVIEQNSYIDFKEMVFNKINENIKFRKHYREGMVLTLRIEMLQEEYDKFKRILNEEEIDWEKTNNVKNNPEKKEIKHKFNFLHNYEIVNLRELINENIELDGKY